ncbi:MAG: hypothetical protein WC518_00815 [Patescibacteria group bacterium]
MNNLIDDDSHKEEEGEELIGRDQEVEQKIEWEEELERTYGQTNRRENQKGNKLTGTGFAKQKQVMEANNFYQKPRRRPPVKLVDQTKGK